MYVKVKRKISPYESYDFVRAMKSRRGLRCWVTTPMFGAKFAGYVTS